MVRKKISMETLKIYTKWWKELVIIDIERMANLIFRIFAPHSNQAEMKQHCAVKFLTRKVIYVAI